MPELYTPLTEHEMDLLDRFMLDRINTEEESAAHDEGVLDISELDGFLTALVSGPVMVPPSQWLPVVWGEYPPVWENEKQFESIFSLIQRHVNGIAATLMEMPDDFYPIFLEREAEEKIYLIVDEWCEGYLRGVSINADLWAEGGQEIEKLIEPILAFTSATKWQGHNLDDSGTESLQATITPSVRAIHAYWLAQREEIASPVEPIRQATPRVGRNEPCPCGSGKKYKKCCLH